MHAQYELWFQDKENKINIYMQEARKQLLKQQIKWKTLAIYIQRGDVMMVVSKVG